MLADLDSALSALLRDPSIALVPFGVVLATSVLARVLAGATPAELWRTRCYEVIPARAVIGSVLLALWLAFGAAVFFALRSVGRIIEAKSNADRWDVPGIVTCVAATIGALVLHGIRRAWSHNVVQTARGVPPRVDCALTSSGHGIEAPALAELGHERFPHRAGAGWRLGLWVRALVALALIAAIVLRFACADRITELDVVSHAPLFDDWLSATPALGMVWVGASAFLALAAADRHYLVTRFPVRLVLLSVVAAVALTGVARFAGVEGAVVGAMLAGAIVVWRMIVDLRAARRVVVRQRAVDPIEVAIADAVPFLTQLARDAGCTLPTLDLAERERRVSQGAENLAEAGALVARRFGRFLRVGQLDHVRCDTALLRFLTVDRWVVTLSGWPTSLPLGGPTVPVWDETLFPIRPPQGFVNWDDALPLASGWNIVCSCGSCGGSGQIQTTETYTEHQNGQSVTRSRTVWRTCTTCSGSGRLECPRALVTGWRRLLPAVVAPHVGTPELVEDALERAFVQRSIVEDRTPTGTATRSTIQDPALVEHADAAAEKLIADFRTHAGRAVNLLGGVLYRADFVVGAFHTVRIRFGSLGNRIGWFFGARPEFHFPRLPLAWSLLGTIWTLPMALLWCAARVRELFGVAIEALP